jgi:hypothetical protein
MSALREAWRFVRGAVDGVLPEPGRTDNGDSDRIAAQADADLRLPPDVRAAFEGPLAEEGFQLTEETIRRGQQGLSTHQVTVLLRGDERYFLVGLSRDVVNGTSEYGHSVVSSLGLIFPAGSRLLLVSPHCDAMHLPLQRTIENYNGITADFVPWLWIRPHNGKPRSAADLLNALNLKAAGGVDLDVIGIDSNNRGREPRRQLAEGDIEIVVPMFVEIITTNGDQEFFNDFVERLSLPPPLRDLARGQWNRSAAIAVRNLLRWARAQGTPTVTKVLALLIESAPGREDAPDVLKILEVCAAPDSPAVEAARESVQRARG